VELKSRVLQTDEAYLLSGYDPWRVAAVQQVLVVSSCYIILGSEGTCYANESATGYEQSCETRKANSGPHVDATNVYRLRKGRQAKDMQRSENTL